MTVGVLRHAEHRSVPEIHTALRARGVDIAERTDFERNQTCLSRNAHRSPAGGAKAGRGGQALLSGLLRCRRCGRMLFVVYNGHAPRQPRYVCRQGQPVHGIASHAAWWVVAGDLAPVTGERGQGWGLAARHDRALVNALLIAPQLAPHGVANFSGAFQRTGFLREFLRELLEETLVERLGGRHTLDEVGSLTLVGASAGGPVIGGLLARRDLADRVRNVVVIDGLYSGEEAFSAWLRASTAEAPRRFVCVHGGGRFTQPHVEAMAAQLRARAVDFVVQPRGALSDAVREHRAVFATVPCEHVGMTAAVYDKVVPSLGMPTRAVEASEPSRDVVRVTAPSAGAMTVGAVARGAFAPGDARLADWTYADDWSLALDAGQRVRVEVRGGRSRGVLCARHDVEVSLLDGDRVIAHDDDGAGAMDARVELAAPHAGSYIVRVMEHDPWAVEGEYTVRVSALAAARGASTGER